MTNLRSVAYSISSFGRFLLRSTNAHGVHSPFIYGLLTKCFYDQSQYPKYNTLLEFRKALKYSDKTIQVLDFGAGSRDQNLQKHQTRPVKQMLSNASVSPKRQRLLFRLVQFFQPKTILELGTHLGMGTIAMASGNSKAEITSVEGCPDTAEFTQNNLRFWLDKIYSEAKIPSHDENQVKILNLTFAEYFEKIRKNAGPSEIAVKTSANEPAAGNKPNEATGNKKFDLIYLDGHHDGPATLEYFEQIKNLIHQDSLVVIDDIHWSQSMTSAWNDIIKDPKVTVSIDTYFWGLIFFRKEQVKEHFVVRV